MTYQKGGKTVHLQLYLEEVLPGDDYIKPQRHRGQQADDAVNGCDDTRTCYDACIYA